VKSNKRSDVISLSVGTEYLE